MDAPRIRPLAAGDLDRWLPLWSAYLSFYETVLPIAAMRDTFRLLDPAEPMRGLVAERGPDLVGLAHTIFHRSCWTAGDYCYLQDLFVSEAARGAGVGEALIEAVYALANEAGAARVYWLTDEANAPARRLYDRVAARSGFIQYRRRA